MPTGCAAGLLAGVGMGMAADYKTRARLQAFLVLALASSALMPFKSLQVPLATYFHSLASMSVLDWPAHEWLPFRLAQSFWPALTIPKHFSLPLLSSAA